MDKTSQDIAGGTNRTRYKPHRNVRFANLGKTIQMWRSAVVWVQLMFEICKKSSFVFRKELLYSPLNLSCRIFGQEFTNPSVYVQYETNIYHRDQINIINNQGTCSIVPMTFKSMYEIGTIRMSCIKKVNIFIIV